MHHFNELYTHLPQLLMLLILIVPVAVTGAVWLMAPVLTPYIPAEVMTTALGILTVAIVAAVIVAAWVDVRGRKVQSGADVAA